jgi:SAM-dependent methyltransferase
LHVTSGADLAPVPDASAELVFSYIVFQHIPSREVIANYVREAARVLKPGGAFKFQLNGDQSPEALARPRDTWLGETFSEAQALELLSSAGFSLVASEGGGTQYYILTARKGPERQPRSYVLPGEPWAEEYLLEGFGQPVGGSWRPLCGRARVRLTGEGSRLYLGVYFWPESCPCRLILCGHGFDVVRPGDHYFECPAPGPEAEILLEPTPARPPAFRVVGLY